MTYCVSVVVPTYKRPDLLKHCLAALLIQDFDKASYEVIVVDDAPDDATKQLVESFTRQIETCGLQLRYIPVGADSSCPAPIDRPARKSPPSHHGPAGARNIGWHAASGEIIAFTDDDCLPATNWLRAGVNAFVDGVVGVSGKIIVPLASTPTDYERNAAHLSTAEFVTANCFYLGSALMDVGGFDERFTSAWREDSDLFFTLLQHHDKFLFVPEAVVIHPMRSACWGISLRQQRKSMFNALLYKKHPSLYRQRIQAAPPWHYYGIVIALLSACIAALGGLWLFACAAFGIWLCLTARFCFQRLRHTSHAPGHILEMMVTSMMIPPLSIYWRIFGAIKFRVFFL